MISCGFFPICTLKLCFIQVTINGLYISRIYIFFGINGCPCIPYKSHGLQYQYFIVYKDANSIPKYMEQTRAFIIPDPVLPDLHVLEPLAHKYRTTWPIAHKECPFLGRK
jgi:hypothetical protein